MWHVFLAQRIGATNPRAPRSRRARTTRARVSKLERSPSRRFDSNFAPPRAFEARRADGRLRACGPGDAARNGAACACASRPRRHPSLARRPRPLSRGQRARERRGRYAAAAGRGRHRLRARSRSPPKERENGSEQVGARVYAGRVRVRRALEKRRQTDQSKSVRVFMPAVSEFAERSKREGKRIRASRCACLCRPCQSSLSARARARRARAPRAQAARRRCRCRSA